MFQGVSDLCEIRYHIFWSGLLLIIAFGLRTLFLGALLSFWLGYGAFSNGYFYKCLVQRLGPRIEPMTVQLLWLNSQLSTIPLGYSDQPAIVKCKSLFPNKFQSPFLCKVDLKSQTQLFNNLIVSINEKSFAVLQHLLFSFFQNMKLFHC